MRSLSSQSTVPCDDIIDADANMQKLLRSSSGYNRNACDGAETVTALAREHCAVQMARLTTKQDTGHRKTRKAAARVQELHETGE